MAGPGGVEAGRARIVVLPDLSRFGASLKKYVQRVERQLVVQVPTQLDGKGVTAQMAALKAKLERDGVVIKANVDSVGAKVKASVAKAQKTAPAVKIRTEVDKSALSTLTTITGQLRTSAASAGAALASWGPPIIAAAAAAVTISPAIATIGPAATVATAAIGTLLIGLNGIGEAIAASADPAKFAKAMQGMSAEAKKTVTAVVALKPALAGLQTSVQDALLSGIGPAITQVADALLPTLRAELTAMATAFNGGAKSFAAFVASGPGLQLIRDNLRTAREALAPLGAAFGPLTTALLQIGVAAAPALKAMSQGLANAAVSFGSFTARASQSGALQATITGAARGIGQLLSGIGAVLGPLVQGLAAAGPTVIAGLTSALKGAGAAISLLISQAPKLSPVMSAIGTAVAPLSTALQALGATVIPQLRSTFSGLAAVIAPIANGLLKALVAAVTPVVDGFRQALAVVGPQLLPTFRALGAFIGSLLPTIQQLGAQIGQTLGAGLAEIGALLASKVLPAIQRVLPVLQPVAKFLLQTFGAAIVGALNGALNVIKGVLRIFSGLLDFITGVFTGNWSLAWAGIKDIFAGAWNAIKGVVEVLWNVGVVKLLRGGITVIKGLFTGLGGALKTLGTKAFGLLETGIRAGAGAVWTFTKSVPGLIAKSLGSLGKLLWKAGQDVVGGLVGGLKSSAGSVVQAAKDLAGKIPEPIRKLLRIASPSKVMIEIGRFVAEGLTQGLLGSSDQVASAAQELAQKVADGVRTLQDQRASLAAKIAADAEQVKAAQAAYATAVRSAGSTGAAALQAAALRLQQAQDKASRDQAAGKSAGVIATDKAALARAQLTYRAALAKQGSAAKKTIESARKKLAGAVTKLNADKAAMRDLDASFLGLAGAGVQARLQALVDASNAQLQSLADQRTAVAEKLKTAQDQLAEALQVRDSYATQLRDALIAFGDVTKAQQQASGAITARGVVSSLKKQLAAIVSFRSNVAQLRTGGLTDAALQQILAAGVDGGAATAAAIVKGGRDAITAVNALTQDIAAQAVGLGTEAGRWFYQAGVDTAQSLVDGLAAQQSALDTQASQVASRLVEQIKAVLGIAVDANGNVSGSALYGVGQTIGQSLAAGMDSTTAIVQQAAARLAAAATGKTSATGSLGRSTVGTKTNNVTVFVTNPVPEPASTSTTKVMRTLALHGA